MYTGTRPGVSPAIRAEKGWRGRPELALRCCATQLSACLCVHIDRDMIVIPSSEPQPPLKAQTGCSLFVLVTFCCAFMMSTACVDIATPATRRRTPYGDRRHHLRRCGPAVSVTRGRRGATALCGAPQGKFLSLLCRCSLVALSFLVRRAVEDRKREKEEKEKEKARKKKEAQEKADLELAKRDPWWAQHLADMKAMEERRNKFSLFGILFVQAEEEEEEEEADASYFLSSWPRSSSTTTVVRLQCWFY